jgi:hypothetical protein
VGEDLAVHSDAKLKECRGEVPFLNGGLFDLEDKYDVREGVKIPNETFAAVFDLFDRYNFTVTESTALDIEVAVDPEMLGKVFEELVTGRHETGSYYTPRPIVAFMCREALKHYLAQTVCDETAVARFVDDGDPTELPDPEAVLNALGSVPARRSRWRPGSSHGAVGRITHTTHAQPAFDMPINKGVTARKSGRITDP